MKTVIIILITILTFTVIAFVVYTLGVKFDTQNYTHAPIALSCMYSFFLTLVSVGGYFFTKGVINE